MKPLTGLVFVLVVMGLMLCFSRDAQAFGSGPPTTTSPSSPAH